MKATYVKPDAEVIQLDLRDGTLAPISGGLGTGSDMLDPDLGQNPFSVMF
jgi:hypothetical protein